MPKPTRPTPPKPRSEFTIEDRYFNKRQDPEVQRDWIIKILDAGRDMTDWENGFVNRMNHKLDNHWRLTETEASRLEQIYADRTPN